MGTGDSECGQMAALRWYTNPNAESHGNRNRNPYRDSNTYCLGNWKSYGIT
jgi:hypothetical protein